MNFEHAEWLVHQYSSISHRLLIFYIIQCVREGVGAIEIVPKNMQKPPLRDSNFIIFRVIEPITYLQNNSTYHVIFLYFTSRFAVLSNNMTQLNQKCMQTNLITFLMHFFFVKN